MALYMRSCCIAQVDPELQGLVKYPESGKVSKIFTFYLFLLFLIMCMCVSVYGCVHMSAGAHGVQRYQKYSPTQS